jgi:hypothetical protein
MQNRSKSKTLALTPRVMLTTHYPSDNIELDPTTYSQAVKYQHWREAMVKELDALTQNNTWTRVPSSEATTIVSSK